MNKITKELEHFDIAQICDSGQCFRMQKLENGRYRVIAGNRYLEVEQQGKKVDFFCEETEFEHFWSDYFDLNIDYGKYIEKINPKDTYLLQAAELGSGIRILRQDLWEMIVSFLISQQNNIVRIRRCIDNICRRYGQEMQAAGVRVEEIGGGGLPDCAREASPELKKLDSVYWAFPTPEELAAATEEELRECNLGYRAKYVLRAARDVAEGKLLLEEIAVMDYPEAREALLKFYGVGEKVADCICLFALHQQQAFPVDTHIRQALEQHYKKGFPKRRYKGMEGVIQQYIFYYELKKS